MTKTYAITHFDFSFVLLYWLLISAITYYSIFNTPIYSHIGNYFNLKSNAVFQGFPLLVCHLYLLSWFWFIISINIHIW